MRNLRTVLALLCLSASAISPVAHANEIKIGAGAAPTENILKPIRDAFEKSTGIKLTIVSAGPKNAMIDLDRGAANAAAAGLTYEDLLALMKKEGAEVKDPASFQPTVIGKDKILVMVHKDNPVAKLSKDQLKGIFTGETASWKDVGGKDEPTIVVWGKLIPGTNSLFVKIMLDGKPQSNEVLDATTAEDVRQKVASNPSAVGIGPLSINDGTIKIVETPEVSRPIILVTKGKPDPLVQKLIDFINGEGKKLVKQ